MSDKKIRRDKPYVMLIIPSLGNGGAERMFSYLANNIDPEKFTVELVVIDSSNIKYPINSDIKVYKLDHKRISRSVFKIINLIRKKQPDIVFSTLKHLNILMAMLKPLLGKNVFLIGRESSIISQNILYESYPAVFGLLVKKFYKNFDLLICQSNDMMTDLVDNFYFDKSKALIINNLIGFKKPALVENNNKVFSFLTVGRVEKVKGYDRILLALKDLKKDFIYTIIGEGSLMDEIKALVQQYDLTEKVILMGGVSNAIPYYQNANVYLHGSYFEGFPNVLLEAAANGIPIVAYNSPGGTGEIVIESLNGILVKDHDNEAYKGAIEKSMNYKFNREEIQRDIFDRFEQSKIIAQYEQMLLTVLNKKNN